MPSKNPHWGDCGEMVDCGLAQVFGFALDGNRIWFTEWVENNIGVVDTSIPLPFRVDVQSDKILANAGERVEITAKITPAAAYAGDVEISLANPAPDDIRLSHGGYSADSGAVTVIVDIDDDAAGGTYKILVGAQNDEITISQYATVEVPPPV